MNEASFKRVKFSDDKINELFAMLNTELKRELPSPFFPYGEDLRPTKFKYWRFASDPSTFLADNKFNAYCTVSTGHVYENFQNGRAPSADERVKRAHDIAEKINDKINYVLASSNDDMFSKLESVIVNKKFIDIRTHEDTSDDGDDYFGSRVFFKFRFKDAMQ